MIFRSGESSREEEYRFSIRRSVNMRNIVFENFTFLFIAFSADSWPKVFDDSRARADWGWNHRYGLDQLCKMMIDCLQLKYKKQLKT